MLLGNLLDLHEDIKQKGTLTKIAMSIKSALSVVIQDLIKISGEHELLILV